MHTGIPPPPPPSLPTSSFLDHGETQPPQIASFKEDTFKVGPSYLQEQVPELIQQPQPPIRVTTPPPPPPFITSRTTNQSSNSPKSVLSMPIPGTKLAPEKFRGDFHKVKEFIQHFERLCIQNNVTLDREICETLLRYCSKREKQTIKNMPSYNTRIWSKLREDILRLYDADLDTKRYKVKDVRLFSKRQKNRKIRDLAAWKKYCRKFLRIAGSLVNGGKISQKEYATYFWQGIPKALKIRIENRILTRNPLRDLSEPYSVFDIDAAAEAILQRDRFDTALDDSDSEDDQSSGDESSSEDSDDESSESESEDEKRRRRNKRKGRSTGKGSFGEVKTSKAEPPKRKVGGGKREVESLIRQMNLLTQEDPEYGLAYYRATKLDPDVSKIVGRPIVRHAYSSVQPRFNGATFQQSIQPFSQRPPAATLSRPAPPPNISPANRTIPQSPPAPRGSEIVCYGCGEKGHGMMSCSVINDLINKGLLTKDKSGRIVHKDGTPIRRINGETFLQAYNREVRPISHLIMVQDNDEYYESDKESDRENEEDFVYAIRGDKVETFEVERPAKQIATKRRMVIDGVYPPRVKDLKKDKENIPQAAKNPDTGRPIRGNKNKPNGVGVPKDIRVKPHTKEPIPVDIHEPRYDGTKDNQIIEDEAMPGSKNQIRKDHPKLVTEDKAVEKRVPRKSAVAAHVNPFNVLNHVLNTKVELAVGEIFGISRELSTMLADSIKIKPQPSASVGIATSFRTKTRGLLIKLSMECDGAPIEAIIDTGSQLNVVSEAVCNSKIRRPIDRKSAVSMSDANGGEGNLIGIVENVPLNCGGVNTEANLYVGEHVPFDLLLGRPWQRGNYVSIDERRDGTYLLFKDEQNPHDLKNRYEILVTPDALSPVDWDFDPSTWLVQEAPRSYLIKCDSAHPEANQLHSLITDKPSSEGSRDLDLSHSTNFNNISALQSVLRNELIRHTYQHYLNKEGTESIKEQDSKSENTSTLAPVHLPPKMAMRLGPARVQHDSELPSLFTTPPTPRTEAERLLMGQGDLTHFGNNSLTRQIIASSSSGVVVGHLPDQHGNRRTDLMLFNMGLISSLAPNAPNSSSPLDQSAGVDIQHGVGILHFYPNLGSDPPGNWQIPFFVPPVRASVSLDDWANVEEWAKYDPFQVPPDSAVELPFPAIEPVTNSRARSPPFGFSTDRDSDFEFASSYSSSSDDEPSGDNEIALPCIRCLSTHFGSCSRIRNNSLVLSRVSPSGRVSSDISFDDSMPELESISSDSLSSIEFSNRSTAGSRGRNPTRDGNRNLVRVLSEDRARRLSVWDEYEREARTEAQEFRYHEMINGLTEIYRDGNRSPTPELLVKPISSPSSDEDESLATPPDTPTDFGETDSLLMKRRKVLNEILDDAEKEIKPNTTYSAEQILNLNRARRLASGSFVLDSEDTYHQAPIAVYSVSVPSPPPSPIRRRIIPLETESETPSLIYPDPMITGASVEPTTVFGADVTRLQVLTDLQEQAIEYIRDPDSESSQPPSPTDTEPVDHSISVTRRQFPLPRQHAIDRDPSPEIDMVFGSQVPHFVQPFLDNDLPDQITRDRFEVQHFTRMGPRTNTSIPINRRTYYPYADSKVHVPVPRVERIALVDMRTMTFPGDPEAIARASLNGSAQVFSILTPRPPGFDLTLFPGYITPNNCGPLDFPNITVYTLGERYCQVRDARQAIMVLYSRIRGILPQWLVEELEDARYLLYNVREESLAKKYVDRGDFFRSLHPVYNPLIKESEATFLRGAAYAYYRYNQAALADAIDQVLRTPHFDFHLCRELLELGCLDEFGRDEQAYRFMENYEAHAKGDGNPQPDEDPGDDDQAMDGL